MEKFLATIGVACFAVGTYLLFTTAWQPEYLQPALGGFLAALVTWVFLPLLNHRLALHRLKQADNLARQLCGFTK